MCISVNFWKRWRRQPDKSVRLSTIETSRKGVEGTAPYVACIELTCRLSPVRIVPETWDRFREVFLLHAAGFWCLHFPVYLGSSFLLPAWTAAWRASDIPRNCRTIRTNMSERAPAFVEITYLLIVPVNVDAYHRLYIEKTAEIFDRSYRNFQQEMADKAPCSKNVPVTWRRQRAHVAEQISRTRILTGRFYTPVVNHGAWRSHAISTRASGILETYRYIM